MTCVKGGANIFVWALASEINSRDSLPWRRRLSNGYEENDGRGGENDEYDAAEAYWGSLTHNTPQQVNISHFNLLIFTGI